MTTRCAPSPFPAPVGFAIIRALSTWACPDDIAKFHDVARFATRVAKIKSQSKSALAQAAAEGRRFEPAYFDGSHHRDDVPADSFAAWPPIVAGGIVIWDDYEWRRH